MWIKPWLVPAYTAATLFPRLLHLPGLPAGVQVTELLFLVLLPLFGRDLAAEVRRYPAFSIAVGAYVLANLTAGFWAGTAGAMVEAGARGYLGLLPFLVGAHLRLFGDARIISTWILATGGVAAAALLYYLLFWAGMPDYFGGLSYFDQYPYFGSVYRLRATAHTYGMWVMLLLPGLILAYDRYRRGTAPRWQFGLIAVALLPALSKETLLAAVGLALLSGWPSHRKYAAAVGLTVVLLLATHYVVVSTRAGARPDNYVGDRVLVKTGNWEMVETVYLPIKRITVRVARNHPWLGVGPGQLVRYSTSAARPGELPENFGPFDPHSAWTGAFAETGLLGLLSLLALVAVLFHYRPEHLGVFGVLLLLFLIASVFKDVMNFRGLWVLVGIYLSSCLPQDSPPAADPADGRRVLPLGPWKH